MLSMCIARRIFLILALNCDIIKRHSFAISAEAARQRYAQPQPGPAAGAERMQEDSASSSAALHAVTPLAQVPSYNVMSIAYLQLAPTYKQPTSI